MLDSVAQHIFGPEKVAHATEKAERVCLHTETVAKYTHGLKQDPTFILY
jgi:hypothetical protein